MKNKKVVTIGGGTGSFTLLTGLKKYPVDITAIVSMADDGGSTGVLRDELGVLPPGDVRQCLVALSDSSEMLRELMNYRFDRGGFSGHSFGNLLLSALEKINGSFAGAVAEAAKILNVRGEVVPVTEEDTNLHILLKNGKLLKGENNINHNFEIEKSGVEKIYLSPAAKANRQAVKKILEADIIIIGPGNYYCSVLPNFLVRDIPEAIRRSKAKVVLNCNLVNKKGHSEKFSLDDYVDSINRHIGENRIDFVTFNSKKPGKELIKKYQEHKGLLVEFDEAAKRKRNYRVVKADILSEKNPRYHKADVLSKRRSFIRHDSEKLAKVLMIILELGDYENIIKDIV